MAENKFFGTGIIISGPNKKDIRNGSVLIFELKAFAASKNKITVKAKVYKIQKANNDGLIEFNVNILEIMGYKFRVESRIPLSCTYLPETQNTIHKGFFDIKSWLPSECID